MSAGSPPFRMHTSPTQASNRLCKPYQPAQAIEEITFLLELQSLLTRLQESSVRRDFIRKKIVDGKDLDHKLKLFDSLYQMLMPQWHYERGRRRNSIAMVLDHTKSLLSSSDTLFLFPECHKSAKPYTYSEWMHCIQKVMTSAYWTDSGIYGEASNLFSHREEHRTNESSFLRDLRDTDLEADASISRDGPWKSRRRSSKKGQDSKMMRRIALANGINCRTKLGYTEYGRPQALAKFISGELVKVQKVLDGLQQKYCDMRKLVVEWQGTQEKESTPIYQKEDHKTSRIFYNRYRTNYETLKYCNWCSRVGHIERNCWRKKDVCSLCGSGSHTLTACAKYTPPKYTSVASVPLHKQDSLREMSMPKSRFQESRLSPDKSQQQLSNDRCRPSRTGISQLMSSGIDLYFESLKEQNLDDSGCFRIKGRTQSEIFEEPPVCQSERKNITDDYCRFCLMNESLGIGDEGKKADLSTKCTSGKSEILLTSRDETWDISSIEDCDSDRMVARDEEHIRGDRTFVSNGSALSGASASQSAIDVDKETKKMGSFSGDVTADDNQNLHMIISKKFQTEHNVCVRPPAIMQEA